MTAAPSPHALASLEDVKAWLNQAAPSAGDDQLQRLIGAVSRAVLSYLSRPSFLLENVVDTLSGQGYGQRHVVLRRWPVVALTSVSFNGVPVPVASSSTESGAYCAPWDGIPPGNYQRVTLCGYGVPRGFDNLTVAYRAGYAVLDEAATVPDDGTLASTALNQPYGKWAADVGVSFVGGDALVKVGASPAAGQYSVAIDPVTLVATYTFNVADEGKVVAVSYSYVPADVAQAVIELVALRFKDKDRIGVNSKSLGGQETVSFIKSSMTDAVKDLLQNYRALVPMV